MSDLAATLRLLLVTDDQLVAGRDLLELCRSAVRGGVTSVQLRLKLATDAELYAAALRLVVGLSVPVFVNDRVDVALAAGAAGVHLGADDIAPTLARTIVPPSFVIGASVGSEAEISRGDAADYWGIGPLHSTSTKADAGAALGLAEAIRLRGFAGGRPCVAIGGVTANDVDGLRNGEFAGVAVVRAILGEADVERAARELMRSREP